MEIKNLSISDLKAAFDFVQDDINQLKSTAKEKGVNPEDIQAYPEILTIYNKLYNQLLNISRDLN